MDAQLTPQTNVITAQYRIEQMDDIEPNDTLHIVVPQNTIVIILRNGIVLNKERNTHTSLLLECEGIYRVEAYTYTLGFGGCAMFIKPWFFANPLYVHSAQRD